MATFNTQKICFWFCFHATSLFTASRQRVLSKASQQPLRQCHMLPQRLLREVEDVHESQYTIGTKTTVLHEVLDVRIALSRVRGGATTVGTTSRRADEVSASNTYLMLARAIQSRLVSQQDDDTSLSVPTPPPDHLAIVQALRRLATAQTTLKGLDGAAHEAYQRTHKSNNQGMDEKSLLTVQGRAQRSAARTSAVAHGLEACELCEMLQHLPAVEAEENTEVDKSQRPVHAYASMAETALTGRQILLNITNAAHLIAYTTHKGNKHKSTSNVNVSLLVLYEPDYQGGAGVYHGSIQDMTTRNADVVQGPRRNQGRLLVVVGDDMSHPHNKDNDNYQLDERLISILNQAPKDVRLQHGPEVASVQSSLYRAAGTLLQGPLHNLLQSHNTTAIHFVGHSLSGGIAALAATILNGDIPLPHEGSADAGQTRNGKKKHRKSSKSIKTPTIDKYENALGKNSSTIQGLGYGRTSALTLGAPPCMSANIPTDYVTAILYGDDFVGRATSHSLDRLLVRTRRALGGSNRILGQRFHWLSDTVRMAASNVQTHVIGSEGEEGRLTVPGRAYLVRPRRLGDACSVHEIGSYLVKGGREALRAAVLWQLNDILLSKSLWKHHQLESYIHGLDRVHLRGLEDEDRVVNDAEKNEAEGRSRAEGRSEEEVDEEADRCEKEMEDEFDRGEGEVVEEDRGEEEEEEEDSRGAEEVEEDSRGAEEVEEEDDACEEEE